MLSGGDVFDIYSLTAGDTIMVSDNGAEPTPGARVRDERDERGASIGDFGLVRGGAGKHEPASEKYMKGAKDLMELSARTDVTPRQASNFKRRRARRQQLTQRRTNVDENDRISLNLAISINRGGRKEALKADTAGVIREDRRAQPGFPGSYERMNEMEGAEAKKR